MAEISRTKTSKLLSYIIIVLISAMAFTGCGSSSASEQSEDTIEPGWDYFEEFNPIGDTYESISSKYESLEDSGVYDGGVTLKVEDQDLYFGFPRYSKEEIEDTDTCTSVYGSLRTVFGITDDYAADDLEEILSLTWKQDYDDLYYANVTRASGSYTVLLMVDTLNELYSPDTGVSIFTHEDNREGADEIPDEDVYVDLHPVESTAISAIGYDAEYSILAIEFKASQELWYYYGVPQEVYDAFESADSIGNYYNNYIKGTYVSQEMQ